MTLPLPLDPKLREAEQRIEWVLAHPAISMWLKAALRSAAGRDPIQTLNDLELLRILVQPKADAIVQEYLRPPSHAR